MQLTLHESASCRSLPKRRKSIGFKLDENMPRRAEGLLVDAGHDVHTALAENLGGRPDLEVFAACQRERRVLITFDLDFSDISPANHVRVWVLRPATQSVANTLALLRGALELVEVES